MEMENGLWPPPLKSTLEYIWRVIEWNSTKASATPRPTGTRNFIAVFEINHSVTFMCVCVFVCVCVCVCGGEGEYICV